MRFVRAVWKLLVGIKDALVLIFMLLFFGLLYAGLSARPAAGRRRRAGDGPRRHGRRAAVAARRSRHCRRAAAALREYRLRDLVAALDAAKDDGRVKAVALDLDGFLGGGQTAIGDLGAALRRVRKAGKPVLAYAAGYTRRRLSARRPRVGNLDAPARRGGDRRAGRQRTSITRACSTSSA